MKSDNFLLILAVVALIGLGTMGYVIYRQDQILQGLDQATLTLGKQSSSDETEAIEKDLNETELEDMDKELLEIDTEINSSN